MNAGLFLTDAHANHIITHGEEEEKDERRRGEGEGLGFVKESWRSRVKFEQDGRMPWGPMNERADHQTDTGTDHREMPLDQLRSSLRVCRISGYLY